VDVDEVNRASIALLHETTQPAKTRGRRIERIGDSRRTQVHGSFGVLERLYMLLPACNSLVHVDAGTTSALTDYFALASSL